MLAKVYHLVVQISVIPIEFYEISFTFFVLYIEQKNQFSQIVQFRS